MGILTPIWQMGTCVNVRCTGWQNVPLCLAEDSPLRTVGCSFGPCYLPELVALISHCAASLLLLECSGVLQHQGLYLSFLPPRTLIPPGSEWLPPSTPIRSLLKDHLLNDPSCHCFNWQSHPKHPSTLIPSTDQFCIRSPSECKLHDSREFFLLCSPLPARPGMGTYGLLTNTCWMDQCTNEWISAVCCAGDWPQPFKRDPTAIDCCPGLFMKTAIVDAFWVFITNALYCV